MRDEGERHGTVIAGLLMRPEHSETKAKTETRKCETVIETETETKNYETDTSPVKSVEREIDFAIKVISE